MIKSNLIILSRECLRMEGSISEQGLHLKAAAARKHPQVKWVKRLRTGQHPT
jgi:hypothetical protein